MKRIAVSYAIGVAVAAVLGAQASIQTTGNIETAEQLVSTKPTGAPLTVSSTTVVPNLNADLLDGNQSTAFAGASETAAELVDLQAQITTVQSQVNASDATLRSQLLCRGGAIRYLDLGDGTVWDCKQNLQWLKDGGCLGQATWDNANGSVLTDFNAGTTGGTCVDYTLGSYKDWRLATKSEWEATFADAVALSCTIPALTSDLGARMLTDLPLEGDTAWVGRCASQGPFAFSGVASTSSSWSSSAASSTVALRATVHAGSVDYDSKTGVWWVWPVRGGQ